MFCAAFLYLQFGFVIFWLKNIGARAVLKMLLKLTTGVQLTSIEGRRKRQGVDPRFRRQLRRWFPDVPPG